MRNRVNSIAGLVLMLFAIIMRLICYAKLDLVSVDRFEQLCLDREQTFYLELNDQIDYIKANMEAFKQDYIADIISSKYSKQETMNKLVKIKLEVNNVKNISVALEDGAYFTSNVTNDYLGNDKEEWYQKARQRSMTAITGRKNGDGTYSFLISSPVEYNEKFIGVICYELNDESIKNMLQTVNPSLLQTVIYDDNGNMLYRLNKNYVTKANEEVRKLSIEHIERKMTTDNNDFEVWSYYDKTEPHRQASILRIIFSIIMAIVILGSVYKIYKNVLNLNIVKDAIRIVAIISIEWIFALSIMIVNYDINLSQVVPLVTNHMEFETNLYNKMADEIYERLQKCFLGDMKTLDNIDAEKMGRIIIESKRSNQKFVGTFYIDSQGTYTFYPFNKNEQITKINFKNSRTLTNNYDKDEYYSFDKLDNDYLLTKIYKLKDSEGKQYGTMGINFLFESIGEFANEYYMFNDSSTYFELVEDDKFYNSTSLTYYPMIDNAKYVTDELEFKFTQSKIDKIKKEKAIVLKSMPKINANRYLIVEEYDGKQKELMFLSLEREKNNNTGLLLSIFGFFIAGVAIIIFSDLINKTQNGHVNESETEIEIEKHLIERRYHQLDPEFEKKLQIYNSDISYDEKMEKIKEMEYEKSIDARIKKKAKMIKTKFEIEAEKLKQELNQNQEVKIEEEKVEEPTDHLDERFKEKDNENINENEY
ncbi:MAG: cache domain-containing protein [Clostridia bacterium]|nr:cache domain-containing protein [Clostridia bacterium]